MSNSFKNYGLSIVLAALFLLSSIGQSIFQWKEYVTHQEEHNAEISTPDFVDEFLSRTFENWQSEFLQVFTFVVLATYLIHKDSPQSRDGDDRRDKKIDEIIALLKKRKS